MFDIFLNCLEINKLKKIILMHITNKIVSLNLNQPLALSTRCIEQLLTEFPTTNFPINVIS